jgi:hypothetical protein
MGEFVTELINKGVCLFSFIPISDYLTQARVANLHVTVGRQISIALIP